MSVQNLLLLPKAAECVLHNPGKNIIWRRQPLKDKLVTGTQTALDIGSFQAL
jgi:hypothetical protein